METGRETRSLEKCYKNQNQESTRKEREKFGES